MVRVIRHLPRGLACAAPVSASAKVARDTDAEVEHAARRPGADLHDGVAGAEPEAGASGRNRDMGRP